MLVRPAPAGEGHDRRREGLGGVVFVGLFVRIGGVVALSFERHLNGCLARSVLRRFGAVEEPGGLQLVDAGEVVEALQPEVLNECRRGDPGDGAARRAPAPLGAIQPASSRMSSVPRPRWTPRISSTSARVTGWW